MTLLILGVLLWSIAHLFPVFMPTIRAGLVSQLGEGPYKGIFTLAIVVSLALIIFGWRSDDGGQVQMTEYWFRHITYLFMLVSVILFGAAKGSSRIRKVVRHPMLTGVAVWSIGHLLVNHEPRSFVLFGGMLIWSVISILGCNRRDGAYVAPEPWSWFRELRLMIISVVVLVALMFGHPYFAGIPLF